MNTMTRGEKLDRALEEAKRAVIKGLLIIWATLTVMLGIGFVAKCHETKQLNMELNRIESEYSNLQNHVEAIYVYRK